MSLVKPWKTWCGTAIKIILILSSCHNMEVIHQTAMPSSQRILSGLTEWGRWCHSSCSRAHPIVFSISGGEMLGRLPWYISQQVSSVCLRVHLPFMVIFFFMQRVCILYLATHYLFLFIKKMLFLVLLCNLSSCAFTEIHVSNIESHRLFKFYE